MVRTQLTLSCILVLNYSKGDVITVTDQSEITAPSGTTTLSSPDFKVMTFNLDGKGIAIELNGKVYVGDEFE